MIGDRFLTYAFVLFFTGSNRLVLERELRHSQQSAYADGTLKNLSVHWKRFQQFCSYLGVDARDVDVHKVCLFAQYLARSMKSPASIRSYIYGLKSLFYLSGLEFPSLNSLEFMLTMKGIEKIKKHVPSKTMPIDLQLLLRFYDRLNMSSQLHVTIWALFLSCFILFPESHSSWFSSAL